MCQSVVFAQTPIKFSLNFKPDGSNAAWFLAQERGYFKEAGLDVTLDTSGGTGDVITRLATNAYGIGFADIGAVIEFAARNPGQAPLATLVLYDRSPLAVVALKKSGISKPSDIAGRVIGAPLSDGACRMFPAFAKATRIDASKVIFKNIDIRVRETLLARGEVDAVMGFDSSVWFNLKALGLKIEDVNFIRYAENGMDLYGNSLLVSRKIMEENPKAVAAFVKITARAWKEAMADPKAAVAAITAAAPLAHGAPLHTGAPAPLGIGDLAHPDFGEALPPNAGEVPMYWACGLTASAALAAAQLPLAITHAPGCMVVTDLPA